MSHTGLRRNSRIVRFVFIIIIIDKTLSKRGATLEMLKPATQLHTSTKRSCSPSQPDRTRALAVLLEAGSPKAGRLFNHNKKQNRRQLALLVTKPD